MARGHGRILTSIWDDPDFTRMTPELQRLYLFLISQPNLNHAGLLPLTEQRWSTKARGLSQRAMHWAIESLSDGDFIAVDREEEELFVSGYFRHANVATQPRIVAAAYDAITKSTSFSLRGVASLELSEAISKAPAPKTPTGVRALILQRDGWQCRTCGWSPGDPVPVAPTGRPIYRGLELDHIHPKSKGGPDTAENFQVLCTTCNCRKGARV